MYALTLSFHSGEVFSYAVVYLLRPVRGRVGVLAGRGRRAAVARVFAARLIAPEDLEEAVLVPLPLGGARVEVEGLDDVLGVVAGLAVGLALGELGGVVDEGLLEVAHHLLADGLLHREVPLKVLHVTLRYRPGWGAVQ